MKLKILNWDVTKRAKETQNIKNNIDTPYNEE